jgi:hypothetical protein
MVLEQHMSEGAHGHANGATRYLVCAQHVMMHVFTKSCVLSSCQSVYILKLRR